VKRTLTLSVLLLLFAGGVVSQVPDNVHEKCKDARDYVGCIQVLTGATVSKEEAEIEEIKNLKKALALLPSRLENTSLRDFSMAIQPFTDALAAAEAVAIVSSDYSIEDKTKILKLINPSLRLSRAIDIYRATWNQSIEYSVEFDYPLDCSMFDWTIDSFNRIMESNVLDYEYFVVRIFSENSCRTRNYRFEGTMQYYIVEASKNILREGKFPKFSKPYKDLTAIKAEWYEANTYDLSEYKSRALEYSNKYSRNENDEYLSKRQTKKILVELNEISVFEDPTLVQIKKMDELLINFQKRRIQKSEHRKCNDDSANIIYSIKLAKFYFDTKEGSRESNLRKVEELSLAVLAANWGPHLLSFESCTQEIYYSLGNLSSTMSSSEYLKLVTPGYELWVGRVIQAQELLAKVEKERAIN
jgi:hypothetical protein